MAVQSQPTDSRPLAPRNRRSSGAASARAITFTALGLAGAGALAWCLLRDMPRAHHDDPIVIDNPQIDIYRKGLTHPEPTYDSSSGKWTIGDAYGLTHITVHSTSKVQGKKTTYSVTRAVDDGSKFEFYRIEDGSSGSSFAIAPEGSSANRIARVIPSGNFAFSKNGKKLTPSNGKRSIGQITFGSESVCVADGPVPTDKPCQTWSHTPDELRVVLCSSESRCRQYP